MDSVGERRSTVDCDGGVGVVAAVGVFEDGDLDVVVGAPPCRDWWCGNLNGKFADDKSDRGEVKIPRSGHR